MYLLGSKSTHLFHNACLSFTKRCVSPQLITDELHPDPHPALRLLLILESIYCVVRRMVGVGGMMRGMVLEMRLPMRGMMRGVGGVGGVRRQNNRSSKISNVHTHIIMVAIIINKMLHYTRVYLRLKDLVVIHLRSVFVSFNLRIRHTLMVNDLLGVKFGYLFRMAFD